MTPQERQAKAKAKAKAKAGFMIDREVFDRFSRGIKKLGLRRDQYLNQVLLIAVKELEREKSPNSEIAEGYLQALHKVSRQSLRKMSVTLDPHVLNAVMTVCRAKRLPRDLFLEKVLDHCERALTDAADLIAYPYGEGSSLQEGETAFSDVMLGDMTDVDLKEILRSGKPVAADVVLQTEVTHANE